MGINIKDSLFVAGIITGAVGITALAGRGLAHILYASLPSNPTERFEDKDRALVSLGEPGAMTELYPVWMYRELPQFEEAILSFDPAPFMKNKPGKFTYISDVDGNGTGDVVLVDNRLSTDSAVFPPVLERDVRHVQIRLQEIEDSQGRTVQYRRNMLFPMEGLSETGERRYNFGTSELTVIYDRAENFK
jgi:hypothetical protein